MPDINEGSYGFRQVLVNRALSTGWELGRIRGRFIGRSGLNDVASAKALRDYSSTEFPIQRGHTVSVCAGAGFMDAALHKGMLAAYRCSSTCADPALKPRPSLIQIEHDPLKLSLFPRVTRSPLRSGRPGTLPVDPLGIVNVADVAPHIADAHATDSVVLDIRRAVSSEPVTLLIGAPCCTTVAGCNRCAPRNRHPPPPPPPPTHQPTASDPIHYATCYNPGTSILALRSSLFWTRLLSLSRRSAAGVSWSSSPLPVVYSSAATGSSFVRPFLSSDPLFRCIGYYDKPCMRPNAIPPQVPSSPAYWDDLDYVRHCSYNTVTLLVSLPLSVEHEPAHPFSRFDPNAAPSKSRTKGNDNRPRGFCEATTLIHDCPGLLPRLAAPPAPIRT